MGGIMRNSWLVGVLVVTVCVLCRSAVAEELFRYNYVEAGYEKGTSDVKGFSPKIDVSDYKIFGSYAVHELVAIGIQYATGKASFNGSVSGVPVSETSNSNILTVGVTLHKMISDNTELGLDLARDHSSYDAFTMTVAGSPTTVPSSTDNTNDFGIRVRTAIVPEFRLLASAGRTTGGSYAASTNYDIGAEYELGKDFSLGVDYGLSTSTTGSSTDYTRGFSISGRYYY
jgi:hypothetical protein